MTKNKTAFAVQITDLGGKDLDFTGLSFAHITELRIAAGMRAKTNTWEKDRAIRIGNFGSLAEFYAGLLYYDALQKNEISNLKHQHRFRMTGHSICGTNKKIHDYIADYTFTDADNNKMVVDIKGMGIRDLTKPANTIFKNKKTMMDLAGLYVTVLEVHPVIKTLNELMIKYDIGLSPAVRQKDSPVTKRPLQQIALDQ